MKERVNTETRICIPAGDYRKWETRGASGRGRQGESQFGAIYTLWVAKTQVLSTDSWTQ